MSSRQPVVRNRQHELILGALLLIGGSYLIYDAYENRGRTRPFALSFLPGL